MKKHQLFFYGWVIVATGIVVQALGYTTRYSFSVIFPALLDDFHWTRDVTAAMLSVNILVYGIVAPIAGGMVDRVGARKTMLFGATLLAAGLALSSWASEPWHFYLSYGVASAVGTCFIGAVPFASVLRNWFERRRGLAFSLGFLGGGVTFSSYPVTAFLVDSVGWRNTFLVEAAVVAVIAIPLIAFFVRYHPREKGLSPDGLEANEKPLSTATDTLRTAEPASAARDWTLARAMKTSRFWMLCLTSFCFLGLGEHIILAHHFVFAIDVGYSATYASSVLVLVGIFFACGSLTSLISDWVGRETTITLGVIAAISSVVALMFIGDTSQPWLLYYHAAAFGFAIGIAIPTITATTIDLFQGPRTGVILGFVWTSFAVGGAIGPWLAGFIFESFHSYQPAFILSIASFAIAGIAIWLVAPRKVRPPSVFTKGRAGKAGQ